MHVYARKIHLIPQKKSCILLTYVVKYNQYYVWKKGDLALAKKKNHYPSFWLVLFIVISVGLFNAALKYAGGLGKNNAAEKEISDYAEQYGFSLSDYPSDIINLFKFNEETREFVLNYPSKIVDFKPAALNFKEYAQCTEPPELKQWDVRWGYMSYNGSVMGLSGSAPTAVSMAALYVTHDMSLTPVHIAQFAAGSEYESDPEKLLSDGARTLSMNITELPKNDKRIRQAVSEEGTAVICLTSGKSFSPVIVIRGINEDGAYLINDTVSDKRSAQAYTFADLNPTLKKCWKYTAANSSIPPSSSASTKP